MSTIFIIIGVTAAFIALAKSARSLNWTFEPHDVAHNTFAILWVVAKYIIFAAGLITILMFACDVPRAEAQARLTGTETRGRYVSASMTLVNVTQDSLARLMPWLGTSHSARVNRLSRIRNGSIRETDSTYKLVAGVLDSLAYARLDTTQIDSITRLYRDVWRLRHLGVAPRRASLSGYERCHEWPCRRIVP